MAPTTFDIRNLVGASPSKELQGFSKSDGAEVNLQCLKESLPNPLFIKGALGHFHSQVEHDVQPANLDIPWPSFLMEKQDAALVSFLSPRSGDELAYHKSQCSTKDPNEEESCSVSVPGAIAEYSPGPPTKGSLRHYEGQCKPCAFVLKGSCASGVFCEFCHLCPPGEKRRRKKERSEKRRGDRQRNSHLGHYGMPNEMQHEAQLPPTYTCATSMTFGLLDNSYSTHATNYIQNEYHQ